MGYQENYLQSSTPEMSVIDQAEAGRRMREAEERQRKDQEQLAARDLREFCLEQAVLLYSHRDVGPNAAVRAAKRLEEYIKDGK